MGSKRRLLKVILPMFPRNIDTFYDLFAGGLVVGLNVKAKHYVANDICTSLIKMFNDLGNLNKVKLDSLLPMSKQLQDKDKFLQLRKDYNSGVFKDNFSKSITLYLLIISSFIGLPRFNSKNEYNMPWCNKERLNDSYYQTKNKDLSIYTKHIKAQDYTFTSKNYSDVFNFSKLKPNDFVYLDPPYRITTATYNDGKRNTAWGEVDDKQLFSFIEKLDQAGVKFAMSNVLSHRGQTNQILKDWINTHPLYVYHLDMNYSNSTYHTKTGKSDEILVTNYSV